MYQLDPLSLMSDEQLLMAYVICNEPDLLMLDAILGESLKAKA